MALFEMLWPRGDRLSVRGWLGLLLGLAGVLVVLTPRLQGAESELQDLSFLLVLGSAFSWSLGGILLRHSRPRLPHLTAAGYQMAIGGGCLALIGLVVGEAGELTPAHFTAGAAFAFFYLLIVGSLVGFVAFNWLIGHVSAAQAGTYAYVNPMVAILVGWLLGNEEITGWIIGGMAVILAGVALVRGGVRRSLRQSGAGLEIPKSEARNSKSETIPKVSEPTTKTGRDSKPELMPGLKDPIARTQEG
jgi:drug/metabolite transporter (DMT)-like permease